MPQINVTIPVLNEAACLARNVERILSFLNNNFHGNYELVIVDNGSTDQTLAIARELENRHRTVQVSQLKERGRGRALRKSWTESRADILSYMDVDLSSDLNSFLPLIEPLVTGKADISIGSRLQKDSVTSRGPKREIISRCYNSLLKMLFRIRLSDAQCGFKAITRAAADALLPLVKDEFWFFDTELLLWAERKGYRIADVPIKWIDDPDSRVKIVRTSIDQFKGILRMRRELKSDRRRHETKKMN